MKKKINRITIRNIYEVNMTKDSFEIIFKDGTGAGLMFSEEDGLFNPMDTIFDGMIHYEEISEHVIVGKRKLVN